jgi:type II secretory pathway pseudopilin PulG
MRRTSKSRNRKIAKLQNQQSGYMLITLMLMVSLAALALLAILPDKALQIKRDQEEEMCHRGTEYMRAIQHFYKKFGRYPTRVEELENTNNMRFIRKRFKDPLMHDQQGKDKDFKLLHMQDISMNNGPQLGGMMGGQPGLGQIPGQMPGQSPNGLGLGGASGAVQQIVNQVEQQQGATGAAPNAGLGQNKDSDEEPDSPSPQAGSPSSPGGSSPFNSGSTTGNGLSNTTFGGGPILGVASLSKAQTIREYNKKNHYNDWIFVYDPTSDRGGLLVGPWQTPNTSTIPGATPAGQMPGAQPQQSGFGQSLGGQSFGGQTQGLQPPQQQPQAPQNQDTPNQQ